MENSGNVQRNPGEINKTKPNVENEIDIVLEKENRIVTIPGSRITFQLKKFTHDTFFTLLVCRREFRI